MKRLLLLSNSVQHGRDYLDHAASEIQDFLGRGVARVLFVPYAIGDWEGYTQNVRPVFEPMGYGLDAIHEAADARAAVREAEAVFIGGGNTFRLLDTLYAQDLLGVIRERVEAGMPYLGSSAGTNVACLTMKTTNDMPIVYPPSFDALRLVPFNINAHYQDPDPTSTHQGETREQRIAEFHEMNDPPVVGLREGAWLRIEGSAVYLGGSNGARLFQRGKEPVEYTVGSRVDFLMG
ncbi:MAG: dipeptidase PepE [Bacteroidetes bacterium]|nr:dipeptidase PepE [Bacteroidota bacterium]